MAGALTPTLKRATPDSLLYLMTDSGGGNTANLVLGSGTPGADPLLDALPGSPLLSALDTVRGDTAAHAINDLFEGPPVGAVNAGGGTPGTGVQNPTASALRCGVRARASSATPTVPDPVSWAVTANVSAGKPELVIANNAVAACDGYLEIRLAHSIGA